MSALVKFTLADCLELQTTSTLVADCEGEPLAVDDSAGTFELTVNWGDYNNGDNITARIINIEGVYGSTRDWF